MTNINENKKSVEEIRNFLTELDKTSGLDLTDSLQNCFDDDELNELDQDDPTSCYDKMSELLDEGGYFNIEIIYYDRAIEYLKENDPSLRDSLAKAEEYGYTPDGLSSEILASLLASDIERNKFYELQSDIEDFFMN